MPRTTVLVHTDREGDWELVESWIERWRDRMGVCPEAPVGCLCCVAWWDVDAPQEALDELPGSLLASSEWADGGERVPNRLEDATMEVPPLQPLRIPAGWVVEYNDLREANPSPQSIEALLLREDLLQLKHPRTGVLVDVGWYGDAESGEFAIYVQAGDFLGKRLHEFRSRDRLAVVTEVERLLRSPGRTA